jgi:hypothetical protein
MFAKLLRYRDLKARGVVNNWPTLRNLIAKSGFPPGRLLGPQTRVWGRRGRRVARVAPGCRGRPIEGLRQDAHWKPGPAQG